MGEGDLGSSSSEENCFPTLEEVVQYIEGHGYASVVRYVAEQYRLVKGMGWEDANGRKIREWRRYFARIARNAINEGNRAATEQTCFDFTTDMNAKPSQSLEARRSRRPRRREEDGVYIQDGYRASISQTAEVI